MGKYDKQSAMASRLLAKFGGACTLKRIEAAAGYTDHFDNILKCRVWTMVDSPFTVTTTPPTDVPKEYSGKAVKTNFKMYEIDGTIIQHGDCLLILENTFPMPKPNDLFEIGGRKYKYVNMLSIDPDGDTAIVYKVQVR